MTIRGLRGARAGGLALALVSAGCDREVPPQSRAGTPELREALFDSLIARTAAREAFSAPKEAHWGFDPLEGNPALPDEEVLLTRENFRTYYPDLLGRALRHLGHG